MTIPEPGTETHPVAFAGVADHAPILVDVPDSAIGKKFIFPVEKRKEYHGARKEQRKTHQERSLSGDYFLAIRCGAADGCIDLHFREGTQFCRQIHDSHMIDIAQTYMVCCSLQFWRRGAGTGTHSCICCIRKSKRFNDITE